MINVRVFGELVPVLGRHHVLELEEKATINTLTKRIAGIAGIKRRGFLGNYRVGQGDLAILINGRNIDLLEGVATVLHDGDEVVILPPAAGG